MACLSDSFVVAIRSSEASSTLPTGYYDERRCEEKGMSGGVATLVELGDTYSSVQVTMESLVV